MLGNGQEKWCRPPLYKQLNFYQAEVEEHFGLEHLRDGEEIPKDFAQLVNPKPWHFK